MRITRLGEGVDATGVLSHDAIARCVDVLREYRTVLDRHGATAARLVATSAVRDAANGHEFLSAARDACGIDPELLTGIEEGRLSMAGAVAELRPEDGPFLTLDIGGGSTELVAGTGPDDPALDVVSLQLGCVRLSERFFHHDPPTADELSTAEEVVRAEVGAAIAEHPRFTTTRRLVGLAGTVTTLSALQHRVVEYDRALIHHSVFSAEQAKGWYATLAADDHATRLARPGMVPGRADVIVGGALLLHAVMSQLGFDECLVSESDILDGLVASLL